MQSTLTSPVLLIQQLSVYSNQLQSPGGQRCEGFDKREKSKCKKKGWETGDERWDSVLCCENLQISLMSDTKTMGERSHCRYNVWYHIFPRMLLSDVSYEFTHKFLSELTVAQEAHSSLCGPPCTTLFSSHYCHGRSNPLLQISLAWDKPWPQRMPCCRPSYDLLNNFLSVCTAIEILFLFSFFFPVF